jgi:ABC-2 type transport system ATP-binding protein
MHLLTAQSFPTSGVLKVFGEHPYENEKVLRQICFVKESQKYPDSFSIRDVLDISARFFPNGDREYAHSLIEDFRLPLTIFDEPYLGLDAVARGLFYDRLIEDYGEHPRTIVLSTHLIDEISRLLEHVLVIDGGNFILDEETDRLRGMAYTVTGPAAKIDAFVRGKRELHREPFGGLVSAVVMGAETGARRDREEAERAGLEFATASLQQLIVYLTKDGISTAKAGDRA